MTKPSSKITRKPAPRRITRLDDGIVRAKLPNGLRVIAKEMHAAPVAALCVWYCVGSRNEHGGITGISHWVEHMMFKGARKYSEADLDRLISRNGGVNNAFTWLDFTAYYETLPADKIALALDLEADRMVNARFDNREVARERDVILNERQMYENSPGFRLSEEIQAAAFKVHPYGHEIIGYACDLQAITREDLYTYYRRYYAPNNAVIAIAGDFDVRDILGRIERRFGRLKPAPQAPPVNASEPPQKGERRVVVRGEGDTDYLALAFHAPEATHADYMALVALDSVLCGASGLSFFGGGASNRSSRLSKALVDAGYAADVGGGLVPTIDPFLYTLQATVMSGKKVVEVEERLWGELDRVKRDGVTRAELDKAIKQTRAQVAFSTETVTNQAFWLGFSEVIADYTWFTTFLERLMCVSPEDVVRVANCYLTRDNVTVGYYLAQGKAERSGR
ncbi:MAG: protease [Candidatus Roseilinea sp.]|nr:MAG: protease [Candidatus Roseilinea sp.]